MSDCRPEPHRHDSQTTIPTIGNLTFPSKCRRGFQLTNSRTTLSTIWYTMFPVWQVCRPLRGEGAFFEKSLFFHFLLGHLRTTFTTCKMQSTSPTIGNMVTGRPYGAASRRWMARRHPSRHPEDALRLPGRPQIVAAGFDWSRSSRPRRSARQRPENRPAHPGGVPGGVGWWCSIPSMV